MDIQLSALKKGQRARLKKINDPELEKQLLCMGCTPGEELWIENLAPLKDPMEIKIQEQFISIRVADAQKITLDI